MKGDALKAVNSWLLDEQNETKQNKNRAQNRARSVLLGIYSHSTQPHLVSDAKERSLHMTKQNKANIRAHYRSRSVPFGYEHAHRTQPHLVNDAKVERRYIMRVTCPAASLAKASNNQHAISVSGLPISLRFFLNCSRKSVVGS